MKPLKLFYSYAHEDESYCKELEKTFVTLRREGLIEEWHDRKIIAGQTWAGEIDKHLEEADIILLLISRDFMASDYCHEIEMKRALERHDKGSAKVVPILLRPTDLTGSLFTKLQGLPTNFKAVSTWKDQDEAFKDIIQGLRHLI